MNPLDNLLSSAGRVPEISEEGMRNGHQKLEAAIVQASAEQTPAHQKTAPPWRRGGWRRGSGGRDGPAVIEGRADRRPGG
jgi:hypothetical protein